MDRRAGTWAWARAATLACAFPKTTEEYRAAAREGRGTMRISKVEVDLPYRKVYANLKAFSEKCFNREVFEGGGAAGYDLRRFELQIVPRSKGKAELSMTIDGNDWIVTDLEAVKPEQTAVTVYTQWKPYIEQVSGWAAGNRDRCAN